MVTWLISCMYQAQATKACTYVCMPLQHGDNCHKACTYTYVLLLVTMYSASLSYGSAACLIHALIDSSVNIMHAAWKGMGALEHA